MTGAPRLAELQRIVWRLLVAPEGVAAGVRALRREGVLADDDLSFLVRPDARLGPVERLDIYADMYFYRLRDCLAEDFPKLRAVLGDARFHNLVTDYLLAHPSTHYSLRELGRALPGFLESHPPADSMPAIADLARLEWERVDVFDAQDAVPLSRERLLERAAVAPGAFALRLVPAARRIRLAAGTLPVWRRIEAGDAPGPDACREAGEPRDVLVWRKGLSVLHRALEPDEARCLDALLAGPVSVAGLGDRLLDGAASSERASERLAMLLESWTRDALLVDAARPAPASRSPHPHGAPHP